VAPLQYGFVTQSLSSVTKAPAPFGQQGVVGLGRGMAFRLSSDRQQTVKTFVR